MFKLLIFSVLSLFIFTGCGLKTYDSGVLEMGPDTYFVSADDLNRATAIKTATTLAQEFCAKLRKEIIVTEKNTITIQRTSHEVTFMCLNKNDYELKRPKYESKPDVIIENKFK